jgi:hypothetical protein
LGTKFWRVLIIRISRIVGKREEIKEYFSSGKYDIKRSIDV